MAVLTFKFGGTSMGSAKVIKSVAQIVLDHAGRGNQVITVVSAMSGITDLLLKAAHAAEAGKTATYIQATETLRARHYETARALVQDEDAQSALVMDLYGLIDQFHNLCKSIEMLGELTNRGLDSVTSIGERLSSRLLAAHLCACGADSIVVEATQLIVTDDTFQNAAPLMHLTRHQVQENLVPLLAEGKLPIVTGFIGATESGLTTTLGRGGSDYSAAIIAANADADELWIWTDVDGVMTTDPRITTDARVIPVLSYYEVGELAFFGAKVVHPRTILPVTEQRMPILVRNTFNPAHPGTRIQPEAQIAEGTMKAITIIRDIHLITVAGRGMIGVPGIAGRTFSAVARENVNLLVISQSSSEQSFCFIVRDTDSAKAVKSIQRELALELERHDVDRVWAQEDVVIVTVVGAGIRSTPGVASRIFGTLSEQNVNVLVIAQGSSEASISLVINSDDAEVTVQSLHKLIAANGS